ncbi:TPA: SIR2 family protein [Clostridium perfringens]|nr:SIR2 family protein [Clostridium perfringens]
MNFEEIMQFNAPYNKMNFDSLVEKIKSNSVVPYIGAGMSMLFDNIYPSWGGFLNDTFAKFGNVSQIDKFDSMNYEDKADFLYEDMGKISFSNHLKTTFSQQYLYIDKCEFVNKPVYLLPSIFNNGLILTTNYDKVIEKVYSALHNMILPVAHPGHFEALNGALRNNELLLFKIHGDINEPIESIILTKEQYKLAYDNPKLIDTLKQIYTSKSMLFLGCSLEKDRPIELLCEVSKSGMSNYAIVPCDNENKKDKRLKLENEYYTQAIIYPDEDHECVKVILEEVLKNINYGKYNKGDSSDEDIYLDYINKWYELADIGNWGVWTSWMLGSGQPHIFIKNWDEIEKLREWLFSRIWPNKLVELEHSFENFRLVLNDLYNIFNEHCEKRGEMYYTEKFYRIDQWDEQLYQKLLDKYNFHVSLIQDLVLELTRAANYICDNIRKFINPSFRLKEGKLVVTYGPCNDFSFKTICPEYKGDERTLKPYPGLDKFKEIRINRDNRFGIGTSCDDPEFLKNR